MASPADRAGHSQPQSQRLFTFNPSQWIAQGFGLSSGRGEWNAVEPPFGPLNAVHHAALGGENFRWDWRVFALYAFIPLFPLYVQAYLLLGRQTPGTRAARMVLGGVAVAGIVKAWMSYRFTAPHYNAFNNGLTVCYLHLVLKSIEFALLQDEIVDPWMKQGRSRIRAAVDLCSNSRMLFLGSVGIDDSSGPPNATVEKPILASHLRHLVPASSDLRPPTHTARKARRAKRSAFLTNGYLSTTPPTPTSPTLTHPTFRPDSPPNPSRAARVAVEPRWMPRPIYQLWTVRPTSRLGAIARHFLHAFTHYVVLDTFLVLLRRMAHDLGAGGHGILESYSLEAQFVALPEVFGGRLAFRVPPGLVAACIEISVPVVIWQGLNFGYHTFATMLLMAGWEVQSWDVDLFDAPWRADSIIDLWGRRWHQVFRHQFILAAMSTLRVLHLPNIPAFLVPLVFIYSGLLHVFGELSMHPVPNPTTLCAFFLLSGVGCALEVAFKAVTGRRVGGLPGRVWCWVYTFIIGRLAADAWLDAGIAGSSLLPSGGAGEFVAPYIVGWMFDGVKA